MLVESPVTAATPAMAVSARIGILRRIFSFPVMLCMALMLLSVLTTQDRFNDPDLWWHLKTGQIIWNTHSIPSTDVFSFTTNQHAWTAHEWLSQVVIYGAFKLAGYRRLMLLLCALTSLLLISQYALCWLYSGNAKVALLGAMVTWLFSTIGLAIRPQLFGYLLLALELALLELGRRKNVRWFWALPPLFAVWVNMHGSFFLGLVILALVLACSYLNFAAGYLVAHPWQPATRRALALAGGLSSAALFLNPVGIRQILYPLDVMLHQKIGTAVVAEWQPLTFDEPRSLLVLLAAALVVLIPLLRRMPLYFHELVLASAGLFLAIQHKRMIFVFGLLVAPILCRFLADTWDSYNPRRDLLGANAFMMVLFACGMVWGFPSQVQLDKQVVEANPTHAVEFVRSSGLAGNMLNEYVFGGYLIWALPEHKVFIDGRADVFEWAGVFKDLGDWATLQADPKVLLDKYKVSFCLLSSSSPMARVLPLVPGWKQVYRDDQATIFSRTQIPALAPQP